MNSAKREKSIAFSSPPSFLAEFETGAEAGRILDQIADVFAEDAAISVTDVGNERWRVAIHFPTAPNRDAVRAAVARLVGRKAALRFARVEAADWVGQSLAGLAPVAAGRFLVHGAHDRARVPPNRIGIEIEAALAFGTGHHGTTRGCLLALDRISKTAGKAKPAPSPCKGEGKGGGRNCKSGGRLPRLVMTPTRLASTRRPPPFKGRNQKLNVLDVGTGSGVLAIAAARALHGRVLASDIDGNAVRIARANARRNRVGALVEVVTANGVNAPRLRAGAPFDLIFANILLGPLLRLAAPLRRLSARGGWIVLSGLLPAQANAAIAAYRPLPLVRRMDLSGWTTLVFRRR